MENYLIDNLDRGILEALMGNARTAYAELAKQFGVSPGTIHVRVEKVTEAYYTTGHYSIFIKVMCRSIDALQHVLINKIQTIDEIQSTETLIVLQNPIMRTIKP